MKNKQTTIVIVESPQQPAEKTQTSLGRTMIVRDHNSGMEAEIRNNGYPDGTAHRRARRKKNRKLK